MAIINVRQGDPGQACANEVLHQNKPNVDKTMRLIQSGIRE
jgi:hypothetical protein